MSVLISLHVKSSKPSRKVVGCTVLGGLLGCKRSTVVTPQAGVARADAGVNATSAASAGAMSSGRIRIFLN